MENNEDALDNEMNPYENRRPTAVGFESLIVLMNDLMNENRQMKQQINQLERQVNRLRALNQNEIDQPDSQFERNLQSLRSFIKYFPDTKWKQNGITVAGGHGQGNELNQLSLPFAIDIDHNQTLYITDWSSDRISEWKSNATNGQIVAGGNGIGHQTDQLHRPIDVILDKTHQCLIIADKKNRRVIQYSLQNNSDSKVLISNIDCWGLALDNNGDLYVSDFEKNEIKRWKKDEKEGTLVAGGNDQGDDLNKLNYPTYIFIDQYNSLYIADTGNHRIMKWKKDANQGIVVAGGNRLGNSLTQLSSPHGLIVDQLGNIYIADSGNHRIIRWCQGDKQGSILLGGNAGGEESNQFNFPTDLVFDQEGNLYVVDSKNNRIQKFEIN